MANSFYVGDAIINSNGKCLFRDGQTKAVYKIRAGVRPVIELKKKVEILGGFGTERDPYILKI